MRELISYILLFVIVNTCFGCGYSKPYIVEESDTTAYVEETYSENTTETDIIDKMIPVYVCGAVVNPGVYYLTESSLKADALREAGGFLDGASVEYVNLAETVASGEKIYFPYEGEQEFEAIDEEQSDGRININVASVEELMSLPGIGKSKAMDIIDYRNSNGMFNSTDEIMNIPGIKEGVYNKIKDSIYVN